jgi:glycosyltransferase involved in cell wall biosynthesis
MTRSRLSVLLVSPVAEAGGAEVLMLDILAGMQERDVDVHLVALGQGPLPDLAESRGIDVTTGSALSFRHPMSVLRAIGTVREAAAVSRPNVVLGSHAKGQVIARLACIGVPGLEYVTQLYDPYPARAVTSMVAARLPGLRLAITEETAASWRVRNPAWEPIVIPPGICTERLMAEARDGDGEAAWIRTGLEGGTHRVVMVARLQRFKGPLDFVEMAALVHRSVPGARFLLIGPDSPIEPHLRDELETTIRDRGLAEFVAVAGRLSAPDLGATVRDATVLVHPALAEPFGLVVLEALTLGTPAVAYATAGPSGILAHGGGTTVPVGDVRALAAEVAGLLDDRERLSAWAAAGRQVGRTFDIRTRVERYLDVLTTAATRKRSPTVTTVGAVPPGPSGVRDYGRALADQLRSRGVTVNEVWLENPGDRLSKAMIVSGRLLATGLRRTPPKHLLWHYSPVAYGCRGIPLHGVLLGAVLRARGSCVVTVLHELAYTYRPGVDSIRGRLMAVSQRCALQAVLRGSSEVIVTTDKRRIGLIGRFERPVHLIPVFSTIPTSAALPSQDGSFLIGVLAYAGDGVRPDILIDALPTLGPPDGFRVVLLGAPGPESRDGQRWQALARQRGLLSSLTFTGVLEAEELSRCLAECTVVALMNDEGPSSRKTSLAAALAHGLPVISIDGDNRWNDVVEAAAIRLVPNEPDALGRALLDLRESPRERAALGERAARFAKEHMNLDLAAEFIASRLFAGERQALPPTPSGRGQR